MKRAFLVLLLAVIMVHVPIMSWAEEKGIRVPDFSLISTFSIGETEDEQFFSCMWAGMLVRKNVSVAGYTSMFDKIGLRCLSREKEVNNDGTIVTCIVFSNLLHLHLNGDPVQSAEILLYADPNEKNFNGAIIPIDLDNDYGTTALGKIEK